MASVSILGSAAVDIASGRELADGLKGASDSIVERLSGPKGPRAIRKRLMNQGSTIDGGGITLSLGTVPIDCMWTLTNFTVTGADTFTDLGANAKWALYFGGSWRFQNRGDLIDVGFAVPNARTYSKETLYGHPNDDLFAVVVGINPLQQIVVTAQVHEWRPGAREELNLL